MKKRSTLAVIMILVIGIVGMTSFAQTDVNFTLADLAGMASSYNLHQAQVLTARAHERRQRLRAWRKQQFAMERHRNLDWLQRRSSTSRTASVAGHGGITPKRAGSGHAVPIAFMQNLTFTFVSPRHQGVPGASLRAVIHPAQGPDRIAAGLVTDANGRIRLTQIGPLPVTVSFDSGLSQDPRQTNDSAADPEWEFPDSHSASLRIATATGRRVATYNITTFDFGSAKPERVASLIGAPACLRPLKRAVRKVMVFEDSPAPIVLERTVVDLDLGAPPGATVTTPALPGQEMTVGESGHVALRLPVSALADGPVALRVGQRLPGGESETVVDTYGIDPYSSNAVQAALLRLARIERCQVTGGIGVLDSQDAVVAALGNRKRAHVAREEDRGEWWDYGKGGLSVRMRKIADGTTIAERIRLTSAAGGSVGGIAVGGTWQSVLSAFGPPDAETVVGEASPQLRSASYLDGGLRIVHDAATVRWIDVARSTPLLEKGTTAFVRRAPARLFVQSFHGHDRTPLTDKQDLEGYLRSLPSVRLVQSRDEADLVLTADVSSFTEKKDDFLIGSLPFKYRCDAALEYSLYDARSASYAVRDKESVATAGADFTAETVAGLIALGVLGHQKGDAPKLLALVLGMAGAAELQRGVRNAVNHCPAIAMRTACDALSSDIGRAADFSVRVVGVDYGRSLLRINAGSEDGVRVSTLENPCEFEVLVMGSPLPGSESGGKADYSTAVVVSAGAHEATCELRRVRRRIDRFREKMDEKPDPDMARRIPDPATGAVSARAMLRFPSVDVVPASALVSDDKADDALRQGALHLSESQRTPPQP